MCRRERQHVNRLKGYWAVVERIREGRKRRGFPMQEEQRKMEREVRKTVVGFRRWSVKFGWDREETAGQLGIRKNSLGRWEKGWSRNRLGLVGRGRPSQREDRATRNLIIGLFHLMGPGVGLPTLREIFPDVARRELEDLLQRYRKVTLRKGNILAHVLLWRRRGGIWAMDFTEPPRPVDGIYPYLFVVRDVTTGRQLMAIPLKVKCGTAVRGLLLALFLEHGPPLVIKSDNDATFISEIVKEILGEKEVTHLLSPPGTPEYNGACEAGIGALKTRAHHEAIRYNRPGEWTCDDVEAARLMANETARPWGLSEPTPDELWMNRKIIDIVERLEFRTLVEEKQREAREERGLGADQVLDAITQAGVDRVAISRALVAKGYLQIRRRRITLPIKKLFRQKIS